MPQPTVEIATKLPTPQDETRELTIAKLEEKCAQLESANEVAVQVNRLRYLADLQVRLQQTQIEIAKLEAQQESLTRDLVRDALVLEQRDKKDQALACELFLNVVESFPKSQFRDLAKIHRDELKRRF